MLIAAIMQRWGWRASFYLCALLGVAAALAWRLYATNRPEEHRRVNAAELELIRSTQPRDASPAETRTSARPPWRRMFSSISVLGLISSYSCIGFPAYVFYTWFFIYLVRVRGLTVTQGGRWGATPFLAIALLAPLGGWFSDRAVARVGKRRGRQSAVWLGVACSATLLWAGSHTSRNTLAILLLAGAAGFNLFATATWWATANDLTRHFCGSLAGLMNMCGNIGGWLAPIVTARIATRFGWTRALDFAALVTLAAGLLWLLVDADQDLDQPSAVRCG
jgi:ACS family glucarate transporter-like MFS transporter